MRDSAANREWHLPLKLKAAGTDALFALVRQLKLDVVKGATVEYKPDGASQSTFFDLERGKLDENYQAFLQRAGWLRCTLKMWTRPHGHTGTTRLLASAAGTLAIAFPATGLVGDVDAAALLRVRVGSAFVNHQVVAYGVYPGPTYPVVLPAASMTVAGPTPSGASGAIGSQYMPLGNSLLVGSSFVGFTLESDIFHGGYYPGRHRAFLVGKAWGFASAMSFYLRRTSDSQQITPSVMASSVGTGGWNAIDLGEFTIPTIVGSDYAPTVAYQVNLRGFAPSIVATGGFDYAGIVFLPLDYSAGILQEPTNSILQRASVILDGVNKQAWTGNVVGQGANARDDTVNLRGNFPKLPIATSTVTIAAVQMGTQNVYGNDIIEVALYAREGFSFFR